MAKIFEDEDDYEDDYEDEDDYEAYMYSPEVTIDSNFTSKVKEAWAAAAGQPLPGYSSEEIFSGNNEYADKNALEAFVDKIMDNRGAISRDELLQMLNAVLIDFQLGENYIQLIVSNVAKNNKVKAKAKAKAHKLTKKKEIGKPPTRFTGFLKNTKDENV